jgi:hypothetical protein
VVPSQNNISAARRDGCRTDVFIDPDFDIFIKCCTLRCRTMSCTRSTLLTRVHTQRSCDRVRRGRQEYRYAPISSSTRALNFRSVSTPTRQDDTFREILFTKWMLSLMKQSIAHDGLVIEPQWTNSNRNGHPRAASANQCQCCTKRNVVQL